MKERPILFSGPMVRAILNGKKTQTRRVIKWPVSDHSGEHKIDPMVRYGGYWYKPTECNPYGKVGDRLWVRETFAHCPKDFKDTNGIIYRADGVYNDYVATNEWHPSIHMARSESRIALEITGIRVERVQDITEEDAKAEGIQLIAGTHQKVDPITYTIGEKEPITYRFLYSGLWDNINLKRSYGWDSNPWVWVIEFKRVTE